MPLLSRNFESLFLSPLFILMKYICQELLYILSSGSGVSIQLMSLNPSSYNFTISLLRLFICSNFFSCAMPIAAIMSFIWHFNPISFTIYSHQYFSSTFALSQVLLSMPSQRRRRARSIHSLLLVKRAPPSPIAKFFPAWNEKQDISPNEPHFLPLYVAPQPCATSSIIGMLPAIVRRASIF